ncbi:MAG: hypothetical protein K1000chlam3_01300 [Chlamydiae bacterium]|nr:hypothetical protein [Chlamydiota bacterium]
MPQSLSMNTLNNTNIKINPSDLWQNETKEEIDLRIFGNVILEAVEDFFPLEFCSGKEVKSWLATQKTQKRFENIQTLDFEGKQISQLPSEIDCFTGLKNLNLKNNNLSGLPSSIKIWAQLETLDLTGNKFKKIPAFLNKMTNLVILI